MLYLLHRFHPEVSQWLWALGILVDFLIIGSALFMLLSVVPARFRRTLIVVCTFLAGLIYSTAYFVPGYNNGENFMTPITEQLPKLLNVVFAFVLGLGIFNLIRFHGQNILRKRRSWPYNLAFFAAFFAMMVFGFWKDRTSTAWVEGTYNALFESTVVALGATMFSSIGFYIISAAYRAFRVRSGEATLMLVAAFIVMLGQVSVGAYLTSGIPVSHWAGFFRLENLSYWILMGPNMAAQRGMAFGIEIGALAMALRIWLSLERGSFFEQEL